MEQFKNGELDLDVGIESKYYLHCLMNFDKKCMIVTARVHPGETQASFALEGMVNFLLSNHKKAVEIRQNYIIYVVPMLNPDGVI
jgi:murein tripeptide amidase MpaA